MILQNAFDAMNGIENSRYQGQDIINWAQDGLIDELTLDVCACPSKPNQPWPNPQLAKEVCDAIAMEGFSVRPHLMPRFMSPHRFVEKAQEYFDAGIEGLAPWDAMHRTPRLSEWAAQRCLGHVEQYDALKDECKKYWRAVPIRQMDGINMTNRDYSANSSG